MTNRQAAIKIIKRLQRSGFQALLAGGCVRDMLLRRRAKDHDVATDALPGDVIRLFRRTLKVDALVPLSIRPGSRILENHAHISSPDAIPAYAYARTAITGMPPFS